MWGNVDSGIWEILLVESGIQLKESGILLKIGIGNPRSTDKKSGIIPYLDCGIHGVESRFQDYLRFPYILHGVKQRRNDKERVYESGWVGYRGDGGGGGEGVVWRCVRDLVALVLYCTVGLWWEILPLRRLAILSFWKKLGHNSSRSLRKKNDTYLNFPSIWRLDA